MRPACGWEVPLASRLRVGGSARRPACGQVVPLGVRLRAGGPARRHACGRVVPLGVPPAGRKSRSASRLRVRVWQRRLAVVRGHYARELPCAGRTPLHLHEVRHNRNRLQANLVSVAGGKMHPSTMAPARARQFARRVRLSTKHDVHGPFSYGNTPNDDFSI